MKYRIFFSKFYNTECKEKVQVEYKDEINITGDIYPESKQTNTTYNEHFYIISTVNYTDDKPDDVINHEDTMMSLFMKIKYVQW